MLEVVLAGRSSTPNAKRFAKLNDLPNLGTADGDQTVACTGYLVSFAHDPIRVRHVAGATGTPYFFDQLNNPHAVTLVPAGQWHDDVVIAGTVGNAHNTPQAAALMQIFRKAISKSFRRVSGVWVGEAAFTKWEAGGRLTAATQSPPEFDLAR